MLFLSTAVVALFLAVETAVSLRHERALRARGAVEPPDDVHRWMRMAYPGCFIAMIVEGLWRGQPPVPVWWAGVALFAASKALKIWAIHALGPLWSFRVLVLPGAPLVTTGPYRRLRHPNYVAVAGELAAVALMFGAPVAGPVSIVGFGWLMRRRIAVEEKALTGRSDIETEK